MLKTSILNIKIILKLIGILLALDGLFMLSGIPFSLCYKEDDLYPLLISGVFTFLIGGTIYLLTKNGSNDVRKREGYIIVSLGWFTMSLFGALPFVLHGTIPNYTDAFFETVSGFTTTGATILQDIEAVPHGLLFWRSLTQWLGGMGMIVLSLAILPILGIGGMQLFVAEVPGPTKDKIHPKVRETAKRLWGIYVILTLTETLLLILGGMSFYDALNHSLTTMATGGFSTKQNSIAHWNSPFIHYVIIIFMFLAGTNFSMHYLLLHKKFKSVYKNDEARFYFLLAFTITIGSAIILTINNYGDLEKSFRDSAFQIVSIVTTTGYITSDYETWGPFFQVLFFLLLFSGGCAGSTGGGIKMVRHLLLLKNSLLELKRLVHPRAVIPVRFNNRTVSQDIIFNILAFFLFYVAIFAIGTIIMAALGVDIITAMGSVATSLANVGPGIGSVGPIYNFAHIPEFGKWVLSIIMLIGRLEIFTILIIFSPSFWKK